MAVLWTVCPPVVDAVTNSPFFAFLLVVAASAGCRQAGTAPTPIQVGLNPAELVDPTGYGDSLELPIARDLFREGERIRGAQRLAVLPPRRSCLALFGGGAFGAF